MSEIIKDELDREFYNENTTCIVPIRDRVLKTNDLIYKFIKFGTEIFIEGKNINDEDYIYYKKETIDIVNKQNNLLSYYQYEYDLEDIQNYFNKMIYSLEYFAICNMCSSINLEYLYNTTCLALSLEVEAKTNMSHLQNVSSSDPIFDRDINDELITLKTSTFDDQIEGEISEIILNIDRANYSKNVFDYRDSKKMYKKTKETSNSVK